MATSTVARAHCTVGLVMLVPAVACSGIGERQRRVKGVGTMIMARFGKVRRSGKRARAQQRLGRDAERIVGMPSWVDECGHHVNYDIRPR